MLTQRVRQRARSEALRNGVLLRVELAAVVVGSFSA